MKHRSKRRADSNPVLALRRQRLRNELALSRVAPETVHRGERRGRAVNS